MRDPQHAYLEAKRPPASDTALASVVVEHWQARHLHGKAVLITDHPQTLTKLIKKRWITVVQSLQQERTRTIDADKLLTLTHSITRMQQMIIATEPPHEYPAAHFWCITPKQLILTELPRSCRTVYVYSKLEETQIHHLHEITPSHSLIVDFCNNNHWQLQPKSNLEDKVHHAWDELQTFLKQYDISISQLAGGGNSLEAIDDALDTLLDNSSAFLRHARHFQEILHLAQPLRLSYTVKQEYELAGMLARRVALLTPGPLHHSFIQPENDTFSLYDHQAHTYSREALRTAVARHIAAGRYRLAKALRVAFVNNLPVT